MVPRLPIILIIQNPLLAPCPGGRHTSIRLRVKNEPYSIENRVRFFIDFLQINCIFVVSASHPYRIVR